MLSKCFKGKNAGLGEDPAGGQGVYVWGPVERCINGTLFSEWGFPGGGQKLPSPGSASNPLQTCSFPFTPMPRGEGPIFHQVDDFTTARGRSSFTPGWGKPVEGREGGSEEGNSQVRAIFKFGTPIPRGPYHVSNLNFHLHRQL